MLAQRPRRAGPSAYAALVALALALALALTGCASSLVPFTDGLRTANGLSDADVKKLQFYVSDTITMRREITRGGRQITGNHKLIVVSGKTIEEVVIEKGTPGVATSVEGNVIRVSFEPGSSLPFLLEGAEPDQPVQAQPSSGAPNPFPGNAGAEPEPKPDLFSTSGSTVNRFLLGVSSAGTVDFQKLAFGVDGDSLRAHLLIDAEALEDVVETRRVLRGVRLEGSR